MNSSIATAHGGKHTDQAELQILKDSALKFVEHHGDTKRVRTVRRRGPGYDLDILAQMAEQGWLGILVPERYGGVGLGLAEMSAVAEILGGGLIGEPLVSTGVLAARILCKSDNESLKSALLEKLVAGKLTVAVAWQEHANSLDPRSIETSATPEGTKFRLNGKKDFVPGAATADALIVSARLDGSEALFLLQRNSPAITSSQAWRVDGTASGEIILSGLVSREDMLLRSNGAAAITQALDEALIVTSAELLGVMSKALEVTLEYLRTRTQFGKQIGSFQALQHRAVDLYIQQELTRAALREAIAVFDSSGQQDNHLSMIASRVKARASGAALQITRESIQMHGAIGFTDDCDVGLYLKRAVVLAAWLGNSRMHRQRYSGLMGTGSLSSL